MLASYDRAYAERDKTESGSYVQEYVNNFLQGEPTPGHRVRAQAGAGAGADDHGRGSRDGGQGDVCRHQPRDPRRLAAEGGRRGADRCAARRAAITVGRRRGGDARGPTRPAAPRSSHARPIRDRSSTAARSPSSASPSCGCRMASKRGSSRPTSRTIRSSSRWRRPAAARSPRPRSIVEAQLATGQVELSGAGGHRAIDLPKLTAGKIASASPFISLSSHGIQGSSTPANIETALAAAQHQVHGARRRPRRVRADQAPARSGGRQPPEQPDRGLRRQARAKS